ncbi:MAG TPA: response regulator, partial [Polyangiales bacterium]
VVDHRGNIRCDSTQGAGASFIIELPVAAEPAASKPRDFPVAAGGSEGVLLVDDEALVRRALRAVLEQAGFRVFEAGDGSEGLSLLSRHAGNIDVIVLDRSMPRMSGDEFLVQLGSQRSRVPVVLLTGHAGGEPDLDGVDAVMMKPPRSAELLRAIRDVLDARRQ